MYRLKHRSQHGQALVEFLTISAVLLPLFLLMPMIGRYQDMRHATQMASRYVAFDGMTRNDTLNSWKPPEQLAQEVQDRFFTEAAPSLQTYDDTDAQKGQAQKHLPLSWHGPNNSPLIANVANDVKVLFGLTPGPDQKDGFKTASDATIFKPFAEKLDLSTRGIYTAHVSMAVANVPSGLKFYEPFDKLNLSLQSHTSILLDPWTAKTASQVESRISAHAEVFPVGKLKGANGAVGALVSTVDAPGGIPGPRLGELEIWRDVVPDDRLKAKK